MAETLSRIAHTTEISSTQADSLSTRAWLRTKSTDAHDRVDAAFSRFDLACDHAFVRFLLAQQVALRAAHADLVAHRRHDWAAVVATRLDAIASDIASGKEFDNAPLPIPALATPDPLGTAYVVAGSLHGTALLRTRYLATRDPATRDARLSVPRFFSATDWKPLWRDVLAHLDRAPRSASLLSATRQTFAAFANAAANAAGSTATQNTTPVTEAA